MGNELPNVAFQPTERTPWVPTRPDLQVSDNTVADASFSEKYDFGESPHIVRCRSCGQHEYLMREYCRCGAFLRGQMDTHYWDWLATTKPKLKRIERRITIYAYLLMFASLLPASFLAGLFGVLSISSYEMIHPFAFVLFNVSIVISAALFRRAKIIAQKRDRLAWIDFLASEFAPKAAIKGRHRRLFHWANRS